MALSRVKTWSAGEELTYSDLNNEFANIYDNGYSLVTPWVGNFDLNGNVLIFDADADTSIDSSTDDTIDITISGADDFRITANTFTALSGSSITVVSGDVTVTAGNLTITDGATTLANPGSHTNTVVTPVTVEATTSGTPAAGIGTGILFNSESQDENPSNFGQVEFAATDIGTGTEDTYFQVLTRVAGAALTATYRWISTGAFKAIFTHANTADRTYTFPNRNVMIGGGDVCIGPQSAGSGSTRSHEGTVTISSNQNLSGVHFYTDFTLNTGVTLTLPAASHRLVIMATGTITLNGSIAATGAGSITNIGGTDQAGGGGGGDGGANSGVAGGDVLGSGVPFGVSGAGSVNTGGTATQVSGSDVPALIAMFYAFGGAGGGTAYSAIAGGTGGGSIVLSAPTVIMASTCVLNTTGTAGAGGGGSDGGGGGGGGGNVYIAAQSFTDNGATITMTGGSGGAGGGGRNGGAGATGVKQINIYA